MLDFHQQISRFDVDVAFDQEFFCHTIGPKAREANSEAVSLRILFQTMSIRLRVVLRIEDVHPMRLRIELRKTPDRLTSRRLSPR